MSPRRVHIKFAASLAAVLCLLAYLALTSFTFLGATEIQPNAGDSARVSFSEPHGQAGPFHGSAMAFEACDVSDSDEFSEDKLHPELLLSLCFSPLSVEARGLRCPGPQQAPDSIPSGRLLALHSMLLLI